VLNFAGNMVVSCSAYGCTARFQSDNQRRFHSFPSDIGLRKKWIVAMRRSNWNPSSTARICSDHFSLDSYDLTKPWLRNRLKPNAVPTLFHFPQHLQPKVSQIYLFNHSPNLILDYILSWLSVTNFPDCRDTKRVSWTNLDLCRDTLLSILRPCLHDNG